jgi:hypothetical protein
MRPLIDRPEVTEALVVMVSDEHGISRSMVYRLVAKFRKRPQVSSLLPGQRGRKTSARALKEDQVLGAAEPEPKAEPQRQFFEHAGSLFSVICLARGDHDCRERLPPIQSAAARSV